MASNILGDSLCVADPDLVGNLARLKPQLLTLSGNPENDGNKSRPQMGLDSRPDSDVLFLFLFKDKLQPIMVSRQHMISELRNAIAAVEKRPAFGIDSGRAPTGTSAVPQVPAGSLSEIWSDAHRDAGAGLGFALMQARALVSPQRAAILWLQLVSEAQETGLPYGPGLAHFGIDPGRLVIGRMAKIEDLLWVIEEAVACRAVAAVIADVARHRKALDFTASRRLGLRAQSAGAAVFLMRYGLQREASAALFRWHVAAIPSARVVFDAKAPGAARFALKLEKGGRQADERGRRTSWIVEWTQNGMALSEQSGKEAAESHSATALSGPVSAPMGDRLSQTA